MSADTAPLETKAEDDLFSHLSWWKKTLIVIACCIASIFFMVGLYEPPPPDSPQVIAARAYLERHHLGNALTTDLWDGKGQGKGFVCGMTGGAVRFVVLDTVEAPKSALATEGVDEGFIDLWAMFEC